MGTREDLHTTPRGFFCPAHGRAMSGAGPDPADNEWLHCPLGDRWFYNDEVKALTLDQQPSEVQRDLVISNLKLTITAYRDDPVVEARDVVRAANSMLSKLAGDPLLDFDLGGSADIEAEYVDAEEEEP